MAIYEANTVTIFPLSEKLVNNTKHPEEMGEEIVKLQN